VENEIIDNTVLDNKGFFKLAVLQIKVVGLNENNPEVF
jgi:hypothetical protein